MGDLFDQRDSPTWAYEMALRLEPWNAQYNKALAARLIELGRLGEAEPHLALIVEAKRDQPRAWADRGTLLASAGQPDRAAADFAHALEMMPEEFLIFGGRAALSSELVSHAAPTSGCSP